MSCWEKPPTQIIARQNVLYVSYVVMALKMAFMAWTVKRSRWKMSQSILMVIIVNIYRQSQSCSLYRLVKEVGNTSISVKIFSFYVFFQVYLPHISLKLIILWYQISSPRIPLSLSHCIFTNIYAVIHMSFLKYLWTFSSFIISNFCCILVIKILVVLDCIYLYTYYFSTFLQDKQQNNSNSITIFLWYNRNNWFCDFGQFFFCYFT